MKITLNDIDPAGVARVAVAGDVTIQDFADGGPNPMESVLGTSWAAQRVLVSLDSVPYIDSSAIGWMIDCQRRFKSGGGCVVWHSPSTRVREMIDMLKMRNILDVRENESAARSALKGPPEPAAAPIPPAAAATNTASPTPGNEP